MKLVLILSFALGIYLASAVENVPQKPVSTSKQQHEIPIKDETKSTDHRPAEVSATAGRSSDTSSTAVPTISSTKPTLPTVPTTSTIPVTVTPPLQRGSWNVTEGNVTCIVLKGKLELEFTLTTYFNHTTNVAKYDVPVPAHGRAGGSCRQEEIDIYVDPTNNTSHLNIKFNKTDKEYFVQSIAGFVKVDIGSPLGPIWEGFSNSTLRLFPTPHNQSYSCEPEADVYISKGNAPKYNVTVSLKVGELQVQAYKKSEGSNFDSGVDCQPSHHTPDVVPIVVGCALAVLVIAVLVAYLVSRRRSQARGYFSM